MNEVRIEIVQSTNKAKFSSHNGEGNFCLSPLIMQAMNLYEFTFGLIPPLIVDIKVRKKDVQFKLQKFNFLETEGSCLYQSQASFFALHVACFLEKSCFNPMKLNWIHLE